MVNTLKIYKKVSPIRYRFHGRTALWALTQRCQHLRYLQDTTRLTQWYQHLYSYTHQDTTRLTQWYQHLYSWLFGNSKFNFDTTSLNNLSLAVKRKKEANKIPKHIVKFRIFRKVFQLFWKFEKLNQIHFKNIYTDTYTYKIPVLVYKESWAVSIKMCDM